jgi:hypothetical protein
VGRLREFGGSFGVGIWEEWDWGGMEGPAEKEVAGEEEDGMGVYCESAWSGPWTRWHGKHRWLRGLGFSLQKIIPISNFPCREFLATVKYLPA